MTPALRSQEETNAIAIEENEEIVRTTNFSALLMDNQTLSKLSIGFAYTKGSKEKAYDEVFNQGVKKAPGPVHLNFRALHLL